MFGVPIDEPTNVLCDNAFPVNSSSMIESTLSRKHNSIAYHSVRWTAAASIIRVDWIDTNFNLADIMTKHLTAQRRYTELNRS